MKQYYIHSYSQHSIKNKNWQVANVCNVLMILFCYMYVYDFSDNQVLKAQRRHTYISQLESMYTIIMVAYDNKPQYSALYTYVHATK